MSNVDVMLIPGQLGQFRVLEMQAKDAGASCWRGQYFDAHAILHYEDLNPKIAIIHFGSEIVRHKHVSGQEWEGAIMTVLPEQTRRVLVTSGINTPYEGKTVAILLGADMIFDDDQLINDQELMKQLITRGEATPEEIEQRHQSVEINGKREIISLSPEIIAHSGYDYGDDYHLKRKEDE